MLQVLLSAVNQYFILSWAVRFTKATSSFEIKLINSCRNTLCPLQNIKKCWSSSFWFCLQTKHLLTSTGMGTPQISYFSVCIRVLNLRKHNFGHWANFGSCRLRTASPAKNVCACSTKNDTWSIKGKVIGSEAKLPAKCCWDERSDGSFFGSDSVAISCHCKRSKIILVKVLT